MSMMASERSKLKLRRAFALPFYAVALSLSYLSDALASIAAAIAKDP
jgi:hypothetical protein